MFIGLSALTVTLLAQDGLHIAFVGPLRALLLAGATSWTLWFGWRIAELYSPLRIRRAVTVLALLPGCASTIGAWYLLFWVW